MDDISRELPPDSTGATPVSERQKGPEEYAQFERGRVDEDLVVNDRLGGVLGRSFVDAELVDREVRLMAAGDEEVPADGDLPAGDAEPPDDPIWNRLSTMAFETVGPWSRMKANRPMNMMRRTSSANQLSREAALMASHTAAMPISMTARIQKRERAASRTVVSQPRADVTTWFSSVVRTLPSCASAEALARSTTAIVMNARMEARTGRTTTIVASSPGRRGRRDPEPRRRSFPHDGDDLHRRHQGSDWR